MSSTNPTMGGRPGRHSDPSPDAGGRAVAARALTDRPAPRRADPVRPPLEVVPDGFRSPRAQRLQRRALAVIGVMFALVTVFGLVLVHVQLTANQLRLTALQQKADDARVTNLKLRLKVAELESPARIVGAAKQLGLVPAPSITYVPGVASASATTGAPAATSHGLGPVTGIKGWATIKQITTGP